MGSFLLSLSAEECLCQNGGVCVDVSGTCECPSGYTGLRCQLGECEPCQELGDVHLPNSTHSPLLSEVTQTPCSSSRPCPDGGPCLEYGGSYLCTCPPSAAELHHRDFYPYGKSLRQPSSSPGVNAPAASDPGHSHVSCVSFSAAPIGLRLVSVSQRGLLLRARRGLHLRVQTRVLGEAL